MTASPFDIWAALRARWPSPDGRTEDEVSAELGEASPS